MFSPAGKGDEAAIVVEDALRKTGSTQVYITMRILFMLPGAAALQNGAMMRYTARLAVLGVLSITYLSSQARKCCKCMGYSYTTTVHSSTIAEAQMVFCFEGFTGGTCSGNLLGVGPLGSPEECCFLPTRSVDPGLGGGAYVRPGNDTCFSCMTVIGESCVQLKINSCEQQGIVFLPQIHWVKRENLDLQEG